MGANGRGAAPGPLRLTLPDGVTEREAWLILQDFAELKRRGRGELRVAVRTDEQTRQARIVYVGIHQKREFEALREVYDDAPPPPHTVKTF